MIKRRNFAAGLWLSPPEDETPDNSLRRARCVSRSEPWRSRPGSALIVSGNAHSIYYFNDKYFTGVSTALYQEGVALRSGLSGSRLSFVRMPATSNIHRDQLFISGGGVLFKVDQGDTYLVSDGAYQWTVSASGTNEYYLEVNGGGDPGIAEPQVILEDDTELTAGTAGSLTAGEWDWGDNDTLGYDTIYVRLADGGPDPDDEADGYLTALYVTSWGISSPSVTPTLAEGSAGNLTGRYRYALTYYDAKTGSRSNPVITPLLDVDDNYTNEVTSGSYINPSAVTLASLLLHCDGSDGHTTFTDSGAYSHTVTANGNAQGDTAQKKFGTASLLCDGTGDYLTVPAHESLNLEDEMFTIDFWVRFNTLANGFYGLFSSGTVITEAFGLYLSCIDASYQLTFFVYGTGGMFGVQMLNASSVSLSVDTWYHLAVIRGWDDDPEKIAIVLDGTELASSTSIEDIPNVLTNLEIGRATTIFNTCYLNGWIDEFRYTKGTATWSESYTTEAASYGDYNDTSSITVAAKQVELSQIPTSSDDQVTHVEIWRTVSGGTVFFYLARVANGTTTYTDDNTDDVLAAQELPLDNVKPFPVFDDAVYYNASVFWITRTRAGLRGRVYYSPIGRHEAVEGYIEVTSDDDPLQKLVHWRGSLGVFSESGFFQILGTNPYSAREVSGVPGTTHPHTVALTSEGIIYRASDGIRMFTGQVAPKLAHDPVARLLEGENVENLNTFTGTVADDCRGEYIISDTSQTIALDLSKLRWRDIGIGLNAIYYNHETDEVAATFSSNVIDLENVGEDDDNGTDLSYAFEPKHERISEDKKVVIQRVHIDANTNNESLTAYIICDGTATSLGTVQTSSRSVTTLNVGKLAQVVGVRLTGTIDAIVSIYGIDIEV